jgi:hypothetical protein
MERNLMSKGKSYSDAYETAIADDKAKRKEMDKVILRQPPVEFHRSASRDAGLIDPEEQK